MNEGEILRQAAILALADLLKDKRIKAQVAAAFGEAVLFLRESSPDLFEIGQAPVAPAPAPCAVEASPAPVAFAETECVAK